MLTRKYWLRGIGNDSCKVYDQDKHLVATTIRAEDGTIIVNAVNENAALRAQLAESEKAAYDVFGTIDALKEQLAQVRQERDAAKSLVESLRIIAKCDSDFIVNQGTKLARVKEERDKWNDSHKIMCKVEHELRQQLATRTQERDDWYAKWNEAHRVKDAQLNTVLEQLATAQARVKAKEAEVGRLKKGLVIAIGELACSGLAFDHPTLTQLGNIRAGRAMFDRTSCSQCGQEFGPGDHGYSHCQDHKQALTTPAAEQDEEGGVKR